jgi:hypothetical protein
MGIGTALTAWTGKAVTTEIDAHPLLQNPGLGAGDGNRTRVISLEG